VNCLVTELSRVCQDYLLHEKWLITPSLRVGHQWLDSLTSAGCSVVNVRIRTLKGLALELAGPELARLGVTLVTTTGTQIFADTILARLQATPSSYLASLPPTPNLAQTLASAINALRLAEIAPDRLDPECFEAAQKATDLAFSLREYQTILSDKRLVDYADVLRMAADRIAKDESVLPKDVVVLLPDDLDTAPLERALLNEVPESKRLALTVDQPARQSADGVQDSDARLLRWILYPAEAPEARQDGTANIFRAIGEINEIRHVLRTCVSSGRRFDEVELLYTDSETYVPLVYETLARLNSEGDESPQTVPATFAEGIPARYSRPGRALAALMVWIRDGYPQATLVRMIQDGLLDIPGFDSEQFSFTGLAAVFREIPIRIGRERYIPGLNEAIAELEARTLRPDAVEASTNRRRAIAARLKTTKLLLGLITRLLEICPRAPIENKELLNTAAKFLQEFAAAENQLDNYSLNALLEGIRDMAHWTDQSPGQVNIGFHDWLTSLPGKTKVCGSGPRPGCIHVAHALSGGHSGRRHTFIVVSTMVAFRGSASTILCSWTRNARSCPPICARPALNCA
jgi:ATP-dependent helicase/nuclease subunit B